MSKLILWLPALFALNAEAVAASGQSWKNEETHLSCVTKIAKKRRGHMDDCKEHEFCRKLADELYLKSVHECKEAQSKIARAEAEAKKPPCRN